MADDDSESAAVEKVEGPQDNDEPVRVERRPFYPDSELIFGLVGAVGTDLSVVQRWLETYLKNLRYSCQTIKVSKDVIPQIRELPADFDKFKDHDRVAKLMDLGDEARSNTGDYGVLALGVASVIALQRKRDDQGKLLPVERRAYIVDSLKHPEEVRRLREIYPQGFYLRNCLQMA